MELNETQKLLLENGFIEIKEDKIKLTYSGALLFTSIAIKVSNIMFDELFKVLAKK